MIGILSAPIYAAILFFGMVLCVEVGRRIRMRQAAAGLQGQLPGHAAIEAAVFGLFGLMVAFSFSGASARFDARRALITQEANNIGTAYLRLDLLAPSTQPPLRDLFRTYVDSRLEVYRKLPDISAAEAQLARSNEIQGQIWKQALVATRNPESNPDAARLLIPALNDMIDITTTRAMAARSHPPTVLFHLLLCLGLAAALFAGYGMGDHKHRSWLHILGFAAFSTVVIFVIMDLEFPRAGFIRLTAYDQVLIDVRNSMR